jgi:DNA-binding MarR family transcriptional regulator
LKIIEALSTPKSKQQLLKVINVPERTLRYNLSILKRQGYVKEIIVLNDMRKKMFFLTNKGDEKYE